MIDVVFLLLIFFMLAARFGQEAEISLEAAGGSGAPWQGPPRLVQIGVTELRVNGRAIDAAALERTLRNLTDAASDPILIEPLDGTDTQRLLDVLVPLREAGFRSLLLVSP